MTPLNFTRGVRNLNRIQQVARVLTQQGFGHFVERVKLGRFVPVWMRGTASDAPPLDGYASLGRRMTQVCTELGPTFVKLGQMLSTRPDILPVAVLDELRSLQDNVPPFDNAEARRIVTEALGRPLEQCFQAWPEMPIASGSIGQVYRTVTTEGHDVVVKVRRPGIEQIIHTDLQLLAWLAESIEHWMPELRIYRPTMVVQEFEQLLSRELDYVNEASATAAMGEAFARDASIRIPRVYWDLTETKVLTLEAIRGRSIGAILEEPPSDDPELNRPMIARRLMAAFLDQIFEFGAFHADPHPGNILIEPPATIGLIDFGQTGTISEDSVTQLVIILYGAVEREVDLVVDALADLDAMGPHTDRRDLQRALRALFDKYYGLPIKRFDIITLLNEFSEVIRRHDVIIPREVVVIIKSLGMVAGVATRLDPELDTLALLKPRIRRIIRQRLSPRRLARSMAVSGWHWLSILRQTPLQLREGLRRLAAGTWQLNVQHENIDRLSTELDRSSNRLSFSVVIAALIVGSSMLVSHPGQLELLGISVRTVGLIGYLVAGILGFALSWAIFRSGRLH